MINREELHAQRVARLVVVLPVALMVIAYVTHVVLVATHQM